MVSGNLIEGTCAPAERAAGNGIHLFTSQRLHGHAATGSAGTATGSTSSSRAGPRSSTTRAAGNLRYGLHFMYSDSCEYRRNVFAGERRRAWR